MAEDKKKKTQSSKKNTNTKSQKAESQQKKKRLTKAEAEQLRIEEEIKKAEYIKKHVNKPVAAFIGGRSAPAGKRMGHAGAIISGSGGTAQSKIEALLAAGVEIAQHPADIGAAMIRALKK